MPRINSNREQFLQSVDIIDDKFLRDAVSDFGAVPLKDGEDIRDRLLTTDEPYIFTAQILYRFKNYRYFTEESGVDSDRIEKFLEEIGYKVSRNFGNTNIIKSRTGRSYKEGFEGKRYQKDNLICIVYQHFEGPIGGIPVEFICDENTLTMLANNFESIKILINYENRYSRI